MLKLVSGRFGTSGIDAPLEASHDRCVPCCVEVSGARPRIDQDAIASQILIVGGMQRLMEVGDEMDQECEVAISSPPVLTSLFEALRIFVNLARHAVAGGTSTRNVDARIQQTDVDEVPGFRRRVFFAELRIRPDEAASIAAVILSVGTPRMLATWLCAAGVRLSAAITAAISCPSSPHAHARTGISRTTRRIVRISTDGIECGAIPSESEDTWRDQEVRVRL